MKDLAGIIRLEIATHGSIPFSRFMELALYHPQFGYYTREHDPFGKHGDFFTAAQLQPVFGRLIGRLARHLLDPLQARDIVDLGAGRCEMAEAFEGFHYLPLDVAKGQLPATIRGLVFANEFFDALPVDVFEARGHRLHPRHVTFDAETQRFEWTTIASSDAAGIEDGCIVERCPSLEPWLERLHSSIETGYVLVIDYGYTERERLRLPQGTLMSYSRHQALEDVLDSPGERDITAHVNFTSLHESAVNIGFQVEWFESLAATLLRAGKRDDFAGVLEGDDFRNRQLLKTLLYGMGETFRTMLLSKNVR
ncbi:MAG TPA: SAM-dependent methyltransferase [Bryobacteraceae bacterium]|jgi:SAM-dependent MidA family methyltransferase|nr:SAM-dependent methyltransferase [Bryobacteraceae bacterium]